MEIIKQHKVDKIHDKEAAVNYFTFNKDQWVSYDNATTFEQKVKWADSVGFGGLMIWAVDLDDEKFSALSGLIGKDVGEGLDKLTTIADQVGESWSSDDGEYYLSLSIEHGLRPVLTNKLGEDCYSTKCGERCPQSMITLDGYKSSCGDNENKTIYCPRTRSPRECTWRGGETGGSGRSCHGQCHEGELRLLLDKHGDSEY